MPFGHVLLTIQVVGLFFYALFVGSEFVEGDGEVKAVVRVVVLLLEDIGQRDAENIGLFLQEVGIHERGILSVTVVEQADVEFDALQFPPGLNVVGIVGGGVVIIGVKQVEATAAYTAVFYDDGVLEFGYHLLQGLGIQHPDVEDVFEDDIQLPVQDVAKDIETSSFLLPGFAVRFVFHHPEGAAAVRQKGALVGGDEILVIVDHEGAFLVAGDKGGRQADDKEKKELFHTFLDFRVVGRAIN